MSTGVMISVKGGLRALRYKVEQLRLFHRMQTIIGGSIKNSCVGGYFFWIGKNLTSKSKLKM